MEFTEENMYYALAGSVLTDHVLTGGDILNDVYIDAVQLDAEMSGITATTENKEVEVELIHCLVEGPFVMTLAENGEAVIELRFRAHFLSTALTTEPWTITFTVAS